MSDTASKDCRWFGPAGEIDDAECIRISGLTRRELADSIDAGVRP